MRFHYQPLLCLTGLLVLRGATASASDAPAVVLTRECAANTQLTVTRETFANTEQKPKTRYRFAAVHDGVPLDLWRVSSDDEPNSGGKPWLLDADLEPGGVLIAIIQLSNRVEAKMILPEKQGGEGDGAAVTQLLLRQEESDFIGGSFVQTTARITGSIATGDLAVELHRETSFGWYCTDVRFVMATVTPSLRFVRQIEASCELASGRRLILRNDADDCRASPGWLNCEVEGLGGGEVGWINTTCPPGSWTDYKLLPTTVDRAHRSSDFRLLGAFEDPAGPIVVVYHLDGWLWLSIHGALRKPPGDSPDKQPKVEWGGWAICQDSGEHSFRWDEPAVTGSLAAGNLTLNVHVREPAAERIVRFRLVRTPKLRDMDHELHWMPESDGPTKAGK